MRFVDNAISPFWGGYLAVESELRPSSPAISYFRQVAPDCGRDQQTTAVPTSQTVGSGARHNQQESSP
jgi:hypothetical protein